ncbi:MULTISPECIES: TRM11 family methyltransferase [unclassified Crossiella]|uniref:TRM11 family SAM-dependent methyltransferase n=1 Tax=unclassified Crossiella TaxID=2620835 RepID=UPI001FFF58CF|nr:MULTISPECIES: DNA methyltransferase [unclassified Crossiella]MCK2241843.1 site-specific DNA-methyltransferase [Crossiella sp. S99.2]MCK2255746.1 site-specific DNA-methyltransferase [Crossiella sp. S99.1]
MTGHSPNSGPSSVWMTGERTLADQLRCGGYTPATQFDHEQVPPKIAAHAIAALSRPGDLVLDPDCGAGTVPTEALYADRRAIGLTSNPRWRRVARRNITAARRNGAQRPGTVITGDASLLRDAEATGLAGQVDLVLTGFRMTDRTPTESVPDTDCERLAEGLSFCRPLLRAGGRIVVIIRPVRYGGALLDLPARVLEAGSAVGFVPMQRGIALTARVRGHRVITRAGFAERQAAARACAGGVPVALTAHYDVVIFQAPVFPDSLANNAITGWQPAPATALSGRLLTSEPDPDRKWAT